MTSLISASLSLLHFLEQLMSMFLKIDAKLFPPILWYTCRKEMICQSSRWTSVGEAAEQTQNQLQFSSVTQSCLTLCNPMNRSTPGLPVHHQLPESTQTHVQLMCEEKERRNKGKLSLPYNLQGIEYLQTTLIQTVLCLNFIYHTTYMIPRAAIY